MQSYTLDSFPVKLYCPVLFDIAMFDLFFMLLGICNYSTIKKLQASVYVTGSVLYENIVGD
jgi:hypothetical protein